MAGRGQPPRPQRRRHLDGSIDHHRQAGEVGRLADRADHDLARPAHRLAEGAHRRGLAGAGATPEQNRHPRLDRDRQGLGN